jgi:serine/threonine protein kinase, bacterial
MTTITCPYCGQPHRGTAKFCPVTGQSLPAGMKPPLGHPSAATPGLTGRLPPHSTLNNRYLIVQKVGQGGMAAIYLTTDIRLPGRQWAIKEMSESMIQDPQERAQAVMAFEQEAVLLANLDHPNLPRVVDSFSQNRRQYLVMEYIHGQTLENLMAKRTSPFSEGEILPWVVQLCDVLTYLHNQRPQPIIFRDLKPSNIMVTQAGSIKLIDFGIVRFFKPGKRKDTQAFGTMGYAAPEARCGQTDARSDLYSLCVVIYELLTAYDPTSTPWHFPDIQTLNPAVSPEWEHILKRGLAYDRDNRWPDVAAFGQKFSLLSAGVSQPQPVGVSLSPVVARAQVQPAGRVKAPRPTTRLIMAAAQLSSEQLALALGGVVVVTVAGLWWLTPSLKGYPLIWNYVPLISLVAPLAHAVVPRRWVASVAHVVLTFAGNLTIHLRTGGDFSYFSGLFLGVLLSGGFIEVWLSMLNRVKGLAGWEEWKTEMAWYCGMAVIATGLLYELSFGNGINFWLWLGAAFMAALGWFFGDLLHQYLNLRHTGFRRTP